MTATYVEQLAQRIGPDCKGLRYSDPNDFAWLWGVGGRENLDSWIAAGGENLLVLWDGMPDGLDAQPVNITDQLTPYDWTVSLSRHLLDLPVPPPIRIFLVDCFGHQLKYAFGCCLRESVLACCPWLSSASLPDGPTEQGLADLRRLSEMQSLVPPLNAVEDARSSVGALVLAWIGRLSRDAFKHDVNNLLAPLILMERLGAPAPSHLGGVALLQHARRLGLIARPRASGRPRRPEARKAPWLDASGIARELEREVRLILIDDQAEAWAPVIAAALGLKGEDAEIERDKLKRIGRSGCGWVSLYACSTPAPLLTRIDDRIAERRSSGGGGDWRFRLRFAEDGAEALEILLLDLRLATDMAEAEALDRRVRALAARLDRQLDGDWPWGSRLTGAAEGGPTAAHSATTLLARLIASADLSLPVIIFSATGRRGVTEALRPYRTIITSFEKPRILGATTDEFLEGARTQWNAALKSAANILRARSAALELDRCEFRPVAAPPTAARKIVVDIFTEESGVEESGVTIAALIVAAEEEVLPVLYRNSGVEDRFYETFGASFPGSGKTANSDIEGPKYAFRRQAETMASSLLQTADEVGAYVGWIELVADYETGSDPMGGGDVEAGRYADNLYRSAIASLVEAGAYHLMPTVFPDAQLCYRTHLATRSLKYKKVFFNRAGRRPDRQATERVREQMEMEMRRWGLSKVGKEDSKVVGVLQYLGPADARPIVQAISRQYGNLEWKPIPIHARGYTLSTLFDSRERTNAYAAHFATDSILSSPSARARLGSRGFSGAYGPDFLKLLNAARLAVNGAAGRALAVAARASLRDAEPEDVRLILARRIRDEARRMSGREFMTAVNELSPAAHYIRNKGTVMRSKSETASCRVRTADGRVCQCPLPQTDDLWLHNGDIITFDAELSYDTGVPELLWNGLISVDRRAQAAGEGADP